VRIEVAVKPGVAKLFKQEAQGGIERIRVLTMEKLFCPRADKRPPPSETLESPLGKGDAAERFKRGTTDDMLEAVIRNQAAGVTCKRRRN
jgi:hypothetical protein